MATFISLNHYDLVEVAGVDAEKYLQGQLTCDVVHLAAGTSTLTAHCDPQGKMNSLFRLMFPAFCRAVFDFNAEKFICATRSF